MKQHVYTLRNVAALLMMIATVTSCKKDQDKSKNLTAANEESQTVVRKLNSAKAEVFELVWDEEFENNQLDTTKWSIVIGNQHVNNELQAYTADAVKVSGGGLTLTASKISSDGQQYTSGKITTAGKFSIAKGRIEVRMSNANGRGLTEEFNMQGVDFPTVGLPKSGEIDIMMHKNNDTVIFGGIQWDNEGFAVTRATATSFPAQFAVYAVEWDDTQIRYYVNDVLYNTVNINNGINGTDEFQKAFYINLDMTVGGNFAGNDIAPALPNNTRVDYVKVYKLAGA